MSKKNKEVRTEFSDEEINKKVEAGLTKEQALEVLRSQAEHEANDPHDKPPKSKEATD